MLRLWGTLIQKQDQPNWRLLESFKNSNHHRHFRRLLVVFGYSMADVSLCSSSRAILLKIIIFYIIAQQKRSLRGCAKIKNKKSMEHESISWNQHEKYTTNHYIIKPQNNTWKIQKNNPLKIYLIFFESIPTEQLHT